MNVRVLRIAVFMLVALPLFLGIVLQRDQIPITTSSNEARSLVTKAIDQIECLRMSDAIPNLTRAVNLDPNCAYAYYCLAMCATTPAETRLHLNKAMALADKVSEGERMLIQSFGAEVNGDRETATTILHKLAVMYPQDKRAHAYYATLLYLGRKYDEAIHELHASIDIDRSYAPAYNMLGYAETRNGNLADAEKAFLQYTQLLPKEPNPHDSYAELLLKEGKYDQAIAAYQRALSIDPAFHSSTIGIANAYLFKGMPAEARKQLQALFDNATDTGTKVSALDHIASTYVNEGRFDQALEQLNKAHTIAVQANDPVLIADQLTLIGTTVLQSSTIDATKGTYLKTRTPETVKIDESVTYFEDADRAITKSDLPKDLKMRMDAVTLVNKVDVAVLKNEMDKAKTLAIRFNDLTKDETQLEIVCYKHQIRGTIAMAEKNYETAIAELQQSDLRNPLNLYRLSEAYEMSGNTAKAKEVRAQIWGFNEDSFNLAFVRPLTKPTN